MRSVDISVISGPFHERFFNAEFANAEPLDYGHGSSTSVARIVCPTSEESTGNASSEAAKVFTDGSQVFCCISLFINQLER